MNNTASSVFPVPPQQTNRTSPVPEQTNTASEFSVHQYVLQVQAKLQKTPSHAYATIKHPVFENTAKIV